MFSVYVLCRDGLCDAFAGKSSPGIGEKNVLLQFFFLGTTLHESLSRN